MPIESSVSRINDLNPAWPRNSDIVREGAQHIRNIKTVLKQERADRAGFVCMFFGNPVDIPPGWVLCNGQNGTPDMRNMVPVGAGDQYELDDSGGNDTVTLTTGQLPSHSHTGNTQDAGDHAHSGSANNGGYHSHSGTATGGSHRHAYTGVNTPGGTFSGDTDARYTHRTRYTEYDGGHTHTLNVNGGGSHGHSLSINNGGVHKHSFTTNTTGDGDAVDVRQPYRALHFIMWVG